VREAERQEFARREQECHDRYVAHAVARMTPLQCDDEGEVWSYRAPGDERPFLVKRAYTGHWLIRNGRADDTEGWHRVRNEKVRAVLKAAYAALGPKGAGR